MALMETSLTLSNEMATCVGGPVTMPTDDVRPGNKHLLDLDVRSDAYDLPTATILTQHRLLSSENAT